MFNHMMHNAKYINMVEGGYDYKFVTEPPDSLKCLICPQQHAGCGKLFCKVCIDHYKLLSGNDCPYCRNPLADLFTDLRGEYSIVICGYTTCI